MEHLPVQVGTIDPVCVDDADRPDSRCREVDAGRRTQTTGSHHQHFGLEEPPLSLSPYFLEDHLPRVARQLLVGQGAATALPVACVALDAFGFQAPFLLSWMVGVTAHPEYPRVSHGSANGCAAHLLLRHAASTSSSRVRPHGPRRANRWDICPVCRPCRSASGGVLLGKCEY